MDPAHPGDGASSAESGPAPGLHRALLESGSLQDIIAREAPSLRMTTREEREASLQAMLAGRQGQEIWVFAYGSLIWNPLIEIVERRRVCIEGWHRSFCLTTVAGRGSLAHPGLVLALEPGGCCEGQALRLPRARAEGELRLLWQREMITGAYLPRWVTMLDAAGQPVGEAITFVMNQASEQYAGALSPEEVVRRIATGRGSLGSSADYLYRTRDGLRGCGIRDEALEALAQSVEVAQA